MAGEPKDQNIMEMASWGGINFVRKLSTFSHIGCTRREVVIITLQGKPIWHPTNRRNDGSRE